MRSMLTCSVLVFLAIAATTDGFAIINGQTDSDHAAVGFISDGTGNTGSAVLIDPYWVLTSAAFASVATGGSFHVGLDHTAPASVHAISALFPHPFYDPGSGANNIGLVRLSTPVAGVVPLPYLASSAIPLAGETVQFVGYGWTSLVDGSNTLRRECSSTVSDVSAMAFVTYDATKGPYLGDGGGPALLDVGGVEYVAGIISAVADGTLAYTVSTRVSVYAPFIEAVMEDNPPVSSVAEMSAAGRTLRATPNPFNPATEISFVLDRSGPCRLAVFDPRGRKVTDLAAGHFGSGGHSVSWDGRSGGGRDVPSGVYFVVLQANRHQETRKLVLMR